MCIYTYKYIMNSEYREWVSVTSQFSQLVSAVVVFKGICSHWKRK